MILTQEQVQIVEGSLLGDGYITKYGTRSGKNASLYKKQRRAVRDSLEWLYAKLDPFSCNIHDNIEFAPVKCGRKFVVGERGRKLKASIFYTRQHAVFNDFRDRWYTSGKKAVPSEFRLSPAALAVWFMDDGSNAPGYQHAFFSTQSFTRSECECLCDQLRTEFGIGCAIKPDGDGKPVIRINRRWYGQFIDIVRPFFAFESMQYKVSMDPSEYAQLRGRRSIAGARGVRFMAC